MVCLNRFINVEPLVGAFNQEKALVGAFSVIVKTDGSFAALIRSEEQQRTCMTVSPHLAATCCRSCCCLLLWAASSSLATPGLAAEARRADRLRVLSSAVKRSIGTTTSFHNHKEGPY